MRLFEEGHDEQTFYISKSKISTGASVFSRNIPFMASSALRYETLTVCVIYQRQETSGRGFLPNREPLSSTIWCKIITSVILCFLISARI